MLLETLWERLCRVRTLAFVARSASATGWNGNGSGTVVAQPVADGVITFTESGVWQPGGGREIRFSNVFRWSVAGESLRLEHLRFGEDKPVYLFDLVSVNEWEWQSASPHLCGEDCYAASLLVHDNGIILTWSVNGPRKREEIEYLYS